MKGLHQTSRVPLSSAGRTIWLIGQVVAFVVTGLVVLGLFIIPDLTLKIVWYVVVPLLPASFLINAGMWRGLCPLAGVNMLPNREKGFVFTGKWIPWASTVGLVLLGVLVPLRHILLNVNGPALAILLVSIVALALGMGFLVQAKGGFCNSICPVLPVEKLYGQSPLIAVRNPRCVPCTLCTSKGCLDVDPSISVKHAVGPSDDRGKWLLTPFGFFAAAFPGFIYGYFQLSDSTLDAVWSVYQTVFMYAGLSLALVAVSAIVANVSSKLMLPFLGAFSVGLYYWFAVPASFNAFSLSGGTVVRWLFLALVAFWLYRALQGIGPAPSSGSPRVKSVRAASLPKS
jgi:nitrite reductase (NADH) large subunit